jgi:tetratricopeptide (TPR) repeat protein
MRILREIRSLLGNYHVKSGLYHYYRGEYTQAAEFLSRALASDEPVPGSDAAVALHYLTETHLSEAEQFERAGEFDRHHRLGCALERAGDLDGAISAFNAAVTINPSYLAARKSLAFGLMALGRLDESRAQFEQVRALSVECIETPYTEAMALLGEGKVQDAEERLRDAFDRDLTRFSHHFRLGIARLKEEDFEAAAARLRKAIGYNPKFADVHNYLGVALAETGDLNGAVDSFRRSVDINPAYAIAHLNLAFVLVRLGEIKEAERHLGLVLAREPENSAAASKLDEIRTGRVDPRRGARR